MADDIYVDIKDGDDATGDGTSAATAYQHISRALADVSFPLNESQTIKMVGDATSPEDYNYQDSTDTLLELEELEIQAGGELVFEPDGWDNDKYKDGEDSPITGAADGFDPTETKPCILPPVNFGGSRNIRISGVAIANDISGHDGWGVASESGATAELHYCTIEGFQAGLIASDSSRLSLYNSYLLENNFGLISMDGSFVYLFGINEIRDSLKEGIIALNCSNVTIRWWGNNPNTHYRTTISNTDSRNIYTAIHALVNSTISIGRPSLTDAFQSPMSLDILNEVNFNAKGYTGIKLESGSGLYGTQYITFAGRDHNGNLLNQGMDTVPADQQFVGTGNSIMTD